VAPVVVLGATVVDVVVTTVDVEARERRSKATVPLSSEQAPTNPTASTTARASRGRTAPWSHRYGGTVARPSLTPTCLWRATPEIVVALDERFGEPLDAYVNGSQVWLRDDGPGGVTLEWRLHPVAGYRRPANVDTYEVFSSVALAFATDESPPARLDALWEGLEAFAAHGDELEPATLSHATTEALGIPPDACGLVDHKVVADEWERTNGAVSIIERLLAQLDA
jgi:hypothetical protein